MVCLAMARCLWNHPEQIIVTGSVNVEVEYQTPSGKYKYNHYTVRDIRENADRRELTMYIVRSSGGISCTMTARRNSVSEGAEVLLSHSQQHLSGLRETFRLMRKRISNGSHNRTSQKYENFEGESNYHDRLTLYCELKKPKGDGVIRVPYNLKINKFDFTVASDKHAEQEEQQPTPAEPTKRVVRVKSPNEKKKSLMSRIFG
jgi:hypothetical protein